MKNMTLLLTILSALVVTGCDKGADNETSTEAADSLDAAVESVQENAAEAADAIEGAVEKASEE